MKRSAMTSAACMAVLAAAGALAAAPAEAQSNVRFGVTVGTGGYYDPYYGGRRYGPGYGRDICAYDPYACAPYGAAPVGPSVVYETREYYDPMPRWRRIAERDARRDYYYGQRERYEGDYRRYDERYDAYRDERGRGYDPYYDLPEDYPRYGDNDRRYDAGRVYGETGRYGGYEDYPAPQDGYRYEARPNPPEMRGDMVRYDLTAEGQAAASQAGPVTTWSANSSSAAAPGELVRYDIYSGQSSGASYTAPAAPADNPADLLLGGPN